MKPKISCPFKKGDRVKLCKMFLDRVAEYVSDGYFREMTSLVGTILRTTAYPDSLWQVQVRWQDGSESTYVFTNLKKVSG
jgi:hypothetical protein